jgi:hypothetical protein
MQRLARVLAKVGVGAALAGSLFVWRKHKRESVRRTEIDQFGLLLTYAKDAELVSLYSDYEMLVGLAASEEFTYKRDACAAELKKRDIVMPPLRAPTARPGAGLQPANKIDS